MKPPIEDSDEELDLLFPEVTRARANAMRRARREWARDWHGAILYDDCLTEELDKVEAALRSVKQLGQ